MGLGLRLGLGLGCLREECRHLELADEVLEGFRSEEHREEVRRVDLVRVGGWAEA